MTSQSVTIAERTAVRAVLDVYASPHGCEEFWYSNVPDSLGGPDVCGGGSYREIEVRSPLIALDDALGGPDVRGGNLLP